MKRKLIYLAIFALLFAVACGEDGFDIVGPLDSEDAAPDILTGEVVLENMNDHAGVRVELLEIETSLLTNGDGSFILPENLAEGEWTLAASYPFFSSVNQAFVVQNGLPADDLDRMDMRQQVRFTVSCDKAAYAVGETVSILLFIENLTEQTISLSSETGPQTAFAIRQQGQTLIGGLYPGTEQGSVSISIEANGYATYETTWVPENAQLMSGEYELYGIVADQLNYPAYFTPEVGQINPLNESLFTKLVPAVFTIL